MSKTPVNCAGCQKSLAIPDEHLGKQVRCPACKNVFLASAPVELVAAPMASVEPNDPFVDDPFGQANQADPFAVGSAPPYGGVSPQPAYLQNQPKAAGGGYGKKHGKRDVSPDMTDGEQRAFGSGIFLLVVPVIATVLPLMGLQLRRLAKLGDAAPLAGIVLGLVGAGFIAYARRNQKDKILSPILAALFSVVVGVGGFMLLISLNGNSGPGELMETGAPSHVFDNALGSEAENFNEGFQDQHNEAMKRHQEFVEDAKRRGQEMLEDARRKQEEMMKQMRKGGSFPPAGGFSNDPFAPGGGQ